MIKIKIVYNKLIRDSIPEIIETFEKSCVTKILSDEEYLKMIDAKLDEELADLLEVIYATAKVRGYTLKKLEKVCAEKAENRGAFEKKMLLKEVIE